MKEQIGRVDVLMPVKYIIEKVTLLRLAQGAFQPAPICAMITK